MIIIACYNPLKAGRKTNGEVVLFDRASTETYIRSGRATGKITNFLPYMSFGRHGKLILFDVPCGRCVGCRLAKAKEWSGRVMCERSCWSDNFFLTLTYEDAYLPWSGCGDSPTLNHEDVQLFMKRLRAYYAERGVKDVRMYMAGEYGDQTFRPHYHMILFNAPLLDLKYWSKSDLGDAYYTSKTINDLWQKGNVIIGEVTDQSAAYTARYVMKKADSNVIPYDVLGIKPEYTRMSNRPGIGAYFLDKHMIEIYTEDKIYLPNGKTITPSRYFDNRARVNGIDIDYTKCTRLEKAIALQTAMSDPVGKDYYQHLDDLEAYFTRTGKKALTRSKI